MSRRDRRWRCISQGHEGRCRGHDLEPAALQIGEQIGPCTTIAALKQAYRSRLKLVQQGLGTPAYRLGNLVFTVNGKRVGAVGLGRGDGGAYVTLNVAPCRRRGTRPPWRARRSGGRAGDLERPGDLAAWGREEESAALRQPATRLDQRAERGRVDERHLAEVDDQARRGGGGRVAQRSPRPERCRGRARPPGAGRWRRRALDSVDGGTRRSSCSISGSVPLEGRPAPRP